MPPHHGKHPRPYGESMYEIAGQSIHSWPVDTSFALCARPRDITLEPILRVVLGVADESRPVRLRAAVTEAPDRWDAGNPLRPIRAW